jgi:hypothetical protein
MIAPVAREFKRRVPDFLGDAASWRGSGAAWKDRGMVKFAPSHRQ